MVSEPFVRLRASTKGDDVTNIRGKDGYEVPVYDYYVDLYEFLVGTPRAFMYSQTRTRAKAPMRGGKTIGVWTGPEPSKSSTL